MAKKTPVTKLAPFTADQFTATQHSTAQDKADFGNYLVRFIMGGFKKLKWKNLFYQRLMNTRSHIAHYNMMGFWDNWFSSVENRIKFVDHWMNTPIYGDAKFTFSDVERAVAVWLRENGDEAYEVCRTAPFA